MSNVLEPLVNRKQDSFFLFLQNIIHILNSILIIDTVSVITADGRIILGVLKGFDQTINLILDDSFERVFTMNGVEQVKLGVFIIRGENV